MSTVDAWVAMTWRCAKVALVWGRLNVKSGWAIYIGSLQKVAVVVSGKVSRATPGKGVW